MTRTAAMLRALVALVSAALAGCGSTGVGNPYGENGQLELSLLAADEVDAGAGDAEALPRSALERAVLVLARIEWLPCDDAGEPVVQEGPFVVDLTAGMTRPEIPAVDVPDGGLCGFDAPLGPAREAGELGGRSLFFAGTRDDGVRFLLLADMRARLRVRSPDDQSWATLGERRALRWQMRPRRWLRRAELDDAMPSGTGDEPRIILIDVDRHPLLYAAIRARLGSESVLRDERSGAALGSATSEED